MKLTAFGKGVRKHRIEQEIKLKDMATALGVSSSYLSAVEMGRKTLTDNLVKKVIEYFEKLSVNAEDLFGLASETKGEVTIYLEGSNNKTKATALAFARRLPELSEEKKEQLLKLLSEENS